MLAVVIGIMVGWPVIGLAIMWLYVEVRSIKLAIRLNDIQEVREMFDEIQNALSPGNLISGSNVTVQILEEHPYDKNELWNNRFTNVMLWPRTLIVIATVYNNYEKNKFGTSTDEAG